MRFNTINQTYTERELSEARADAVREAMPFAVPRGWDVVDTSVETQHTAPCLPMASVEAEDGMTESERSIMAEFWLANEADEHYLLAGMRPADRELWIE